MEVEELLERQIEEGFPDRLIKHHALVAKVAGDLAQSLSSLGISVDPEIARIMGGVHDAGKKLAPEELSSPGTLHEELGQEVVEALGFPPAISKICRTHGSETVVGLDNEEIVVCLADKIWKGKRNADFEKQVVQRWGADLGKEEYEIFLLIDSLLEEIAEGAAERLRSDESA